MSTTEHSPLKKRIVGAIVLVSLAVIFIPMFLSDEKPYDDGMPVFGSNIPELPEKLAKLETKKLEPSVPKLDVQPISSLPVDRNTPKITPSDIDVVTPVKPKAKVAAKKPVKASTTPKSTSKSTTTKTSTADSAWAVQVASFSSRKNAFKLRDKLRGKSFNSFVEAFKTKKGIRYRVRVGPEVRKADADKKRKLIKKQFKLSGLVVRHNI